MMLDRPAHKGYPGEVSKREPLSPEALALRVKRFNDTTGAFGYITKYGPTGANHHPDRCVCQGDPNPPLDSPRGKVSADHGHEAVGHGACGPSGDTTPHKHYDRPPYACARCMCEAYEPRLPER